MALTKDFRETIRERAQKEPKFRKAALLREAVTNSCSSGDEKTGRAILRNYINATVGFRQLEEATSIPANSLMRMFGIIRMAILPLRTCLMASIASLESASAFGKAPSFEIRPRHS